MITFTMVLPNGQIATKETVDGSKNSKIEDFDFAKFRKFVTTVQYHAESVVVTKEIMYFLIMTESTETVGGWERMILGRIHIVTDGITGKVK